MRDRRWMRVLAGAAVAAVVVVVPGAPAAADSGCGAAERRLFGVASDGLLHELYRCADATPTIDDLGVVDRGDWARTPRVTAASDGTTTTFWTVEGDGQLVRRVQAGPGAMLGPAEVVDATRDWSAVRLLLATPHALLVDYPPVGEDPTGGAQPPVPYTMVQVFRPVGGGLVEDKPLFEHYLGPPLSAVSDGYGEVISGQQHRRAWRSGGSAPDNLPKNSGTLPIFLSGYAGGEDFLGGLDVRGRITEVRQQAYVPPSPPTCVANAAPFTSYATAAAAGWTRLVVPGRVDPEAITRVPKGCTAPYEWQ
ncbi:hypothetical protein [Dactylosporangium sp. NPDC051541]|uniref:hypothetical protein n=1 Tax=Dactylosporangium sp. NPDC051541 TaxID=3363977 RepID=UPI0037893BDB